MPSRCVPLAILLTAALVTTTGAQTKPDFSGDWTYDKSKSTLRAWMSARIKDKSSIYSCYKDV